MGSLGEHQYKIINRDSKIDAVRHQISQNLRIFQKIFVFLEIRKFRFIKL